MPIYTRAHKTPLRKESRTLPISGKGEDESKYYHCWFCGFVCNKDRDELGDSDSSSGVAHIVAEFPVGEFAPSGRADNEACLGGSIGHYHVAARIGADSNPKTVIHNFTSNISTGCPHCGSKNWRGDY